jgi:molecular chaperone GrpE (heat shock protein)
MHRKTIAVATAALAVTLLAGCSGGSGAGSGSGSGDGDATPAAKQSQSQTAAAAQSKAEACKTFSTEVSDATQGLQSQVTELQSDPKAALAKLDQLKATLEDSASKVTNSEVKPKTDAFAGAFSDFVAMTESLADSKDPSALSSSGFTESLQKLQTTGKDFQDVCTS